MTAVKKIMKKDAVLSRLVFCKLADYSKAVVYKCKLEDYSKMAVYKCKLADYSKVVVYKCKVLNSRFTTVLLISLLDTVQVTPFFQIYFCKTVIYMCKPVVYRCKLLLYYKAPLYKL